MNIKKALTKLYNKLPWVRRRLERRKEFEAWVRREERFRRWMDEYVWAHQREMTLYQVKRQKEQTPD